MQLDIKRKILSHLTNLKNISELRLALKGEFLCLNNENPWCNPFIVSIEETRDYIAPWYYAPSIHSQKCVVIRQSTEVKALWRENEFWSLDDETTNIEEISSALSHWKALESQKSVRRIHTLIEQGFWRFDKNIIPKLSDLIPIDLEEVISWDEKNVLTGTRADNLCVVTREEWANICERSKQY